MRAPSATRAGGLDVPTRMLVSGALVLLLAVVTSLGVGWGRSNGGPPGAPGLPEASRQRPGGVPRFVRYIDGVARPLSVATAPDGRVYVTEGSGSRRIRAFDAEGHEDANFAPPDSASHGWLPMYAAVSPAGEVYVTDGGAETVHVLARDGSLLRDLARPDGGWSPLGIAFAPDGRLFVTDVKSGHHRVLAFEPNGRLAMQFGAEGSGDGELSFPNAVALDRQGRIFVADSNNRRVQVFSPNGRFMYRIAAGFSAPRGIAIDDSDRLYVVDTVASNVRVYDVFDAPDFLFDFGLARGGSAVASYPNGLALGNGGQIYVTDREGDRVQVWTRDEGGTNE